MRKKEESKLGQVDIPKREKECQEKSQLRMVVGELNLVRDETDVSLDTSIRLMGLQSDA